MPFVKIQKNNTYSKRFQVKFRRRRIGKTDYYQRKRLILQRCNKYNTPKWRFVVRRTNQRIICQVVYSTLKGDKIKAQADSFELKKYNITAGLTNYPAAYCTGLLTARRLLCILDKENKDKGITEINIAKDFDMKDVKLEEDVDVNEYADKKGLSRPFTCYLDLGLARATNGNRVFAAMKGALDGGINIPHNPKVFPGMSEEKEEDDKKKKGGKKDDKKAGKKGLLRDRILGKHIQDYMNERSKKKDGKNECQFKKWQECLKKAGVKNLEDLYTKAHKAIREKPMPDAKKGDKPKYTRDGKDKNIVKAPNGKTFTRNVKLTRQQRKDRVNDKIKKYLEARKK